MPLNENKKVPVSLEEMPLKIWQSRAQKNMKEVHMSFEKKREKSKSLFDMAATKYTKKNPSKADEEAKEEKPIQIEEDSQTLFKKAMKLHEEVEIRLDHLLRFHDISEQKFYKYLSDPKNFTEEEWKQLEEERAENRRRIEKLCSQLPSGGKEVLQEYLESQQKKEKKTDEMHKTPSSEMPKKGPEQPRKKKAIPKHKWLNMH